MPKDAEYRAYAYRWVVLAVFFLLSAIIQVQWLTFAPVAREARIAYGVSALQVDLLSILYMAVFLVACIPASYVIDKFGIRVGIGVGAVLTGVFGLLKGLFGHSYAMMVASQIGLGVAQPFILNAVTKVAVQWFPTSERATAVGLGTLAQFAGFILVNVATPRMVRAAGASYDLRPMLLVYGVASAAVAAVFLLLMREEPPTPPSEHGGSQRLLSREGFRHLIRQRDMVLVMFLFLIGLGLFNAITTCIDQICEVKGLTSAQSGTIMGAMFLAGIVGAIVAPALSDRLRRRKPFLVAAVTLLTPGLIGMTFAHGYGLMVASAAVLGFFLLGAAGPSGFQYAAEVSYPAPESLSQGIILWVGQVSGILFVVGMNLAGMIRFMAVFVLLSLVNVALAASLRESPLVLAAGSTDRK